MKLFLYISILAGLAYFITPQALAYENDGDSHFTFVVEDGIAPEEYRHVERALVENRVRVLSALGLDSMSPVTVRLWQDEVHYQDVMEASFGARAPGSRGYVFGSRELRILLTGAPSEPREAVHEFVHAASLHLNPAFGNNPRWLWEAVAIYLAGETPQPETMLLFQNGKCPSIRQLDQPFNKGGSIYDVGYYLGDYITSNWGTGAIVALIQTNGDLKTVLGVGEGAFERGWCAFVRRSYGQ